MRYSIMPKTLYELQNIVGGSLNKIVLGTRKMVSCTTLQHVLTLKEGPRGYLKVHGVLHALRSSSILFLNLLAQG